MELPGIKDKERVRKLLQSTANLQFWEVYTLEDKNYETGWQRTIDAYNAKYAGVKDTTAVKDTVAKSTDTAGTKIKDTTVTANINDMVDTGKKKRIPPQPLRPMSM